MADPTTRATFKEYCLRRLGKPVININVADSQVEDRIDDALKKFYRDHHNGHLKVYLKYQVTQTDKDNRYFPVPQNIQGVTNIFSIGAVGTTGGMFDIRYQIALNDLYQYMNDTVVPYYMNRMYLALIEEIFVGKQPIRYNRHDNKIYIDMDWNRVSVGDWMIVEAYQEIGPDDNPDVWGEEWLLAYATALIKKQWGSNLTKFVGTQLMSGIQFNGEKIYNDAVAEIEELEQDVRDSSYPAEFMIG